MKLLVYDFEVFKYDTLLGVIELQEDLSKKYVQIWDLSEIRDYYEQHEDDIWIGHNNLGYDAPIMQAILKKQNPYRVSKQIVKENIRHRLNIKMKNYDTMQGKYSLKATEYVVGKKISETEVDFDLDRYLTEEEKLRTESYNRDDLDQTYENFMEQIDDFSLRLDLMKEFNLSEKYLTATETSIAAKVLGAQRIDGIENMVVKPTLYSNLKLNNQDLLQFYLNEDFRTDKKLKFICCGAEQTVGSGGIHSAQRNYSCERALYFDVSGYYNLTMMNYNLLPRTLPSEAKEKYKYMYHEQLRLKKINPRKRVIYKLILLAVFGAMLNEYTDFYDPWTGLLVTITGQLFLVDLLEKLEPYCLCVQSNTDGIILDPFDWKDKDKIISIVEEWENRTGYVIKKEEITHLRQRDVNNYTCIHDGKVEVHGEALGRYSQRDSLVVSKSWNNKDALIISQGVTDYLIYNKLPEQTVDKHKNDLIFFQQLARPLSYDSVKLYHLNKKVDFNVEKLNDSVINNVEDMQKINRVFALKDEIDHSVVFKMKNDKPNKIAGLPNNCFVYNEDIRESPQEVLDKIDYNFYIQRIYERINEFYTRKEDKIKKVV